ncbi:hypothetical protein [Natronorubrum sp. A-ect3]|uniref:LiaF transmembrane domain-containing protein n=1 Tax=Natronorubrum sp. A-ect3 TaxID=3242698 RepID=UPI00359DC531
MSSRRLSAQELLGGFIVLLGLLLLLDTTGVYDTTQLLQFVPSLFVIAGLYALVSSRLRNVTGPLVVIVVAGGWQLATLGVVEWSDFEALWPLLIVLLGLSVILGQYRARAYEVSDAFVTAVGLFGGADRRVTTDGFVGGELTAVFGGVDLDLRDATVSDRPARVNATAVFGGVDVRVPTDWNVQVDVLPIFGGAEDERPRRAEEHDSVDLVVTGFAAFGGITVVD